MNPKAVDIVSHFTGIERTWKSAWRVFTVATYAHAVEGFLFSHEYLGLSSVRAAIRNSLMSCRQKLVPLGRKMICPGPGYVDPRTAQDTVNSRSHSR